MKTLPLFEPDVEMPLRGVPWFVLCRLAVLALVENKDFNRMVEEAMQAEIDRYEREQALLAHVDAHPELTIEQLADLADANGMTARITLERIPGKT